MEVFMSLSPLSADVRQRLQQALAQLGSIIVGKEEVISLAAACLLARGHLLLEDLPGAGKTTLAKAFAATLGLDFRRIQFTSDLLPADVVGFSTLDPQSQALVFHQGPVFTQLLLADEVNRASPKSQSALLEAMEERQVSVDGETYPLPQPFIVMATQNPTEQLGTFPLPESQLDRFMMRLSMGYPAAEAEKQLYLQGGSRSSAGSLQAVCDARQLQQWQQQVSQVMFAQAAADYVYRLVQATRQSGRFAAGLSPRAGLAVVGAAKAWAFMQGRGHVLPDDVKSVWVAVANHRVKPVQQGLTSAQVLTDLLNHVAV